MLGRIFLHQLRARREHPRRHEIEPGARNHRATMPPVRDLRIEYGVTST